MKYILIIIFSIIVLNVFSQQLPGENSFDGSFFDLNINTPKYYDRLITVSKFNIKKIHVWDCEDSLCFKKHETFSMQYDKQHRLIDKSYFEYNKLKPSDIDKYIYIGKKKIINETYINSTLGFKHKIKFNNKGLVSRISFICLGYKRYNTKIKFHYTDTLLIKKEVFNRSNLFSEGAVTTTYEYNNIDKIIRIVSDSSKRIETFKYDSLGNLCEYKIKINSNYRHSIMHNEFIKYSFSNNKLIEKLTQSFNNEGKENINTLETKYFYDENNLLIKEIVKNLKENTISIRDYKYDSKGLLIESVWKHSDKSVEDRYKLYTYEIY